MTKSRKNQSSSIFRNIKRASQSTIPVVDKGLTKIGVLANGVAVKSAPVVEKGISSVYGTLASGFNLGAKGAKSLAKTVSKSRRSKGKRKGKKSRKN